MAIVEIQYEGTAIYMSFAWRGHPWGLDALLLSVNACSTSSLDALVALHASFVQQIRSMGDAGRLQFDACAERWAAALLAPIAAPSLSANFSRT